jgi:NIPSNAP protein
MNRRKLLASTLAASALARPEALSSLTAAQPEASSGREYYELRFYHLRRGTQPTWVDAFLENAAIPAWNRTGIGPVGVFRVTIGPQSPSVFVLLPAKSLETLVTAETRLAASGEAAKAGAFWDAPASTPAYIRQESSLLIAFETFPKLEVPAGVAEKRPRIFELRTYESHSKKANLKKIEMFNRGEIAIFRRTGLRPVFFGESVVGSRLPNLTYMLVFDDVAAREKAWSAFIADPEWKKLSTAPEYTDTEIVSNITNSLLSPAPYSQI